MMQKEYWVWKREEGYTLMVGLLTLSLLSVLGIYAITTSKIETQIVGNHRRHKIAFYTAEMALNVGETTVDTLLSRYALNEATTPGHFAKDTEPLWYQLDWDNGDSVPVTGMPSGLSGVAASPRYTIEEREFRRDSLTVGIGAPKGVYLFDVVGHGSDTSDTAQTVLRTIYAKRLD